MSSLELSAEFGLRQMTVWEFKWKIHQEMASSWVYKDAHVVTDVWKGYLPLKKDFPGLEQIPSEKGRNFKKLHIHIMNIQGWLRGIHHHCSIERVQGYLDEYHFRYNRRAFMRSIFDLLIERMAMNEPKRLNNKKSKTAI